MPDAASHRTDPLARALTWAPPALFLALAALGHALVAALGRAP